MASPQDAERAGVNVTNGYGALKGYVTDTAGLKSKQTNPLATKNLLEDTDGLRRPP